MKNKKYLDSAENEPCSFEGDGGCFGDVVMHHIRVKGMCGTGFKMGDEFTIPVCHHHHPKCDARVINTASQLNVMMSFWLERATCTVGLVKALESLGEAYSNIINGDNT